MMYAIFVVFALALAVRVRATFAPGALAYSFKVSLVRGKADSCGAELVSDGLPRASLRNSQSTVSPGFLVLGGQRCDADEFLVRANANKVSASTTDEILSRFHPDDYVTLHGTATCGQLSVRKLVFARARKRAVVVRTKPQLRVSAGMLLVVLSINKPGSKSDQVTCVYQGTTQAPVDAEMYSPGAIGAQDRTASKLRWSNRRRTTALIAAISVALLILFIALIVAVCYLRIQRIKQQKLVVDTDAPENAPQQPQQAF